jgi:hypothetical protein
MQNMEGDDVVRAADVSRKARLFHSSFQMPDTTDAPGKCPGASVVSGWTAKLGVRQELLERVI